MKKSSHQKEDKGQRTHVSTLTPHRHNAMTKTVGVLSMFLGLLIGVLGTKEVVELFSYFWPDRNAPPDIVIVILTIFFVSYTVRAMWSKTPARCPNCGGSTYQEKTRMDISTISVRYQCARCGNITFVGTEPDHD